MNRMSTIFLKIALVLIGIPILALCIFLVPKIANYSAELFPNIAYIKYIVFIYLYVTAIPFYFALYQAFKLLSYIDKNKAFSSLSVRALKNIKYCAVTISIFYAKRHACLLSDGRDRRRPGYHCDRIDYYFCFNGDCGLSCCSSKTVKRSDRYKIRK